LSDFLEKRNVVISFVPAAWTPICSDQWPGYNIIQGIIRYIDVHDINKRPKLDELIEQLKRLKP